MRAAERKNPDSLSVGRSRRIGLGVTVIFQLRATFIGEHLMAHVPLGRLLAFIGEHLMAHVSRGRLLAFMLVGRFVPALVVPFDDALPVTEGDVVVVGETTLLAPPTSIFEPEEDEEADESDEKDADDDADDDLVRLDRGHCGIGNKLGGLDTRLG
ncbi:hypothetical protein MMC07_002313 [Pseudocyphellaria aurata]|nr:hypothetical protein [Pseudocyphellaria aurata]